MVGYSPDHAIGTYRIFLIGSQRTVNTRDVRWLQQYYGDCLKTEESAEFEPEDAHKPDSTSNNDSDDDSNDPAYYFSNLPKTIGETKTNNETASESDDDSMPALIEQNDDDDSSTSSSLSSISDQESDDDDEGQTNHGLSTPNPYQRFYNKPGRRAEHSVRSTCAATRAAATTTQDSTENVDESTSEIPITDKLMRELKRLDTSFNRTLNDSTDSAEFCHLHTDFCLYSAVASGYIEPATYKQMLRRPEKEHSKWLKGCDKEFYDFKSKRVWKLMLRRFIPKGRRLLLCKLVFKLKRDGTYRSHLVAMGFSQIPGVDFTDSFAPVVSDVTMRILVILWILYGWYAELIDVEGAFLYGVLELPVYMVIPEGFEAPPDHCMQLDRAIYGLVQSSRVWWKTFSTYLKEIGFTVSRADSCLFIRQNSLGTCLFILYVDDAFFLGDKPAVKRAIQDIRKAFTITTQGTLQDYLGCKFTLIPEENTVYITQPFLVQKLIQKYNSQLTNREYKTPGTPGFTASLKAIKDEDILPSKKMEEYRSGVGMLLYLVKHSRPDIANPTRELSKCLTKATNTHFKELLRVIMFIKQTKRLGLRMRVKGAFHNLSDPSLTHPKFLIWYMKAYCDASYASDPDKRLSVTGFLIYFCGALVSWKSKLQQSQSLSSTEAEYIAIADVVKEIMYVRNILTSVGITVALPIIVRVDNLGAIYLSKNDASSVRTKHVDINFHFVREYCKDGTVLIQFDGTALHRSYVMTKNTPGSIFESHVSTFMGTPPI